MNSVNDIVDENPNYENENTSDDDPETCDLCKELFGNGDGQEISTSACFGLHIVHASCLNKITNDSCPICEDLCQTFCQHMTNFKPRVTLLKTSVKDLEQRAITNLENYGRRLDFDQKLKHLHSNFAKVKSSLVKLESTVDSCPVCKGINLNMYQQMERIKAKVIKLKATQEEVEATIKDLTSTFQYLGSVAAALRRMKQLIIENNKLNI